MGAQYNFILAEVSADTDFWRRMISGLGTELNHWLGPLKTVAVQDCLNESVHESVVRGELSEEVPRILEHEIATFYPTDPKKGCLMLYREGRFLIFSFSLSLAENPADILRKCWRRVGNELSLALMGEELEVSESELSLLMRHGRIPPEIDLCEAAILKVDDRTIEGTAVQHGAVLIRP